jgi:hypothetical protein
VYVWDVVRHDLPGNHKRDYSKHSKDEMRVAQREERVSQPRILSKHGPPGGGHQSRSIKGTAYLIKVGQLRETEAINQTLRFFFLT